MGLSNLKGQVEAVLASKPESRNSDIILTKEVWTRYYDIRLTMSGKPYILLDDLFDLPNQDNIKRIRAKIQNTEHRYLPTSKKVAEQRNWNIDKWRELLDYLPTSLAKPKVAPATNNQAIGWLED